jgi:16S rRNA (cytidine1402-2'-O)-methyltransferase
MGTLYVVSTPIGNLGDMTPRAIETLRGVALIAAEDTRHTGNLLRAFNIDTPTVSYHQHNRSGRAAQLLAALDSGDVALVSDAGTPAIADPGHELIADAIAAGHRIVPVPGASSLLAAVAASGIVAGPFVFVGFLPRVGEDRMRAVSRALATGLPFIVFESPLRTGRTLTDIATSAGEREVVVARELTKLHEEFVRGSAAELAARFEIQPPRGEVVIVIGGEADRHVSPEDQGEDMARMLLAQGMKPSRAAREIAATTGLDSAAAYELVQRVRTQGS